MRCLVIVAAMLAWTQPASAQPVSEEPPPAWGVSARLRMGAATAPFYTKALSETSSEFGAAQLTVIGGFYLLPSTQLLVGFRLPLAQSLVEQPGGSYSEGGAIGNPEIYIEDPSLSWEIAGATLLASVRAAVGIPVAQHGSPSSLLQNRVLALSSALDGWQNPELYEPGVVPVTLSTRAAISPAPWSVSFSAKAPVLIRVSDASFPEEANLHMFGFVPHVEARGTWQPASWVVVGVGSDVVLLIPAAVSAPEGSARSGTAQWGVSPGLSFPIGKHWLLSADFNRALRGPLSGTISIGLGLGFVRTPA